VDVYAYLTHKISGPVQTTDSNLSLLISPPCVDKATDISSSNNVEDFDTLRIEVHDTGVGISKPNQQKLFGEIVQFDAAQLQNGGGSGIGLWISKKIVDLHGGRIGVKSEPGKGSMFYVELDVAPKPASELVVKDQVTRMLSHETDEQSVEAIPSVANNIRVLVVDDSAVNRKMLKRLIQPRVGQISEAENGMVAVSKVRESIGAGSPFDLIFMDATMPEMCGTDATVCIRGLGYQGMIVFLTGNVTPEDIDRFMASGANDVIVKPCTLVSVVKILTSISTTMARNPSELDIAVNEENGNL